MTEQGKAAGLAPAELAVSATRDPLARVRKVARAKSTWWGVAGVLAGLSVVGGLFRHQIHWGDFPTWVLAITTLLALIAAGFGALVAYDVLDIERQRDVEAASERALARTDRARARLDRSERYREQLWAQAEKVTAWFSWVEDKPVLTSGVVQPRVIARGFSPYEADPNSGKWSAVVKNASDLPVLDVRVHFFYVNEAGSGAPWTTTERYASIERFRVIPPGQTRTMELPETVRGQLDECNDQLYLVAITFTDANGQQWYRDERAALQPRGGRAEALLEDLRRGGGSEVMASMMQSLG